MAPLRRFWRGHHFKLLFPGRRTSGEQTRLTLSPRRRIDSAIYTKRRSSCRWLPWAAALAIVGVASGAKCRRYPRCWRMRRRDLSALAPTPDSDSCPPTRRRWLNRTFRWVRPPGVIPSEVRGYVPSTRNKAGQKKVDDGITTAAGGEKASPRIEIRLRPGRPSHRRWADHP